MNAVSSEDAERQLLRSDDHYRTLVERHHVLDDRLTSLVQRHHLSDDEQIEEVALKKEKLALKDQMAAIARRWSSPQGSAP